MIISPYTTSEPADNQFIQPEEIDILKSNYRKKNWLLNTDRFGTEETIYAIYPIADFREFIDKSKERRVDHFIIYFGAFPEIYPAYSLLAGRFTICFVGAKSGDDIYYGDEKPEDGVAVLNSKEQTEMLKKNYAGGRHKFNSEAIGKTDSLGATCALGIFEQFVVEKERQNANGIRIYIAAFPEHYEMFPQLASMQTVVLVGTEEQKSGTVDILYGDKPGLVMRSVVV